MATLPVKWYNSFMRGFPVQTGQIGKMIIMLDAVLVNGFGQVSSNNANVTNGVLTINLSNNETFFQHAVVEITGDDQLKGEHRVIESSNTQIKIALNIPNQTFNSTFYIKYAPLGWTKITPATPANVALYVPKKSFSGFNLYVNDTYGSAAQVRLCRGANDPNNLTDFNNLIDYVPRDLGGNSSYWVKSFTNSTYTISNFLIGDESTLYYHWGRTVDNNLPTSMRQGKIMGCGDINRYYTSDDLAAFITNGIIGTGSLYSISSTITPVTMALMATINSSYLNGANAVYQTFLGNHRGEKGNDFAGRSPDGPYMTSWSGYNGLPVEHSLINTGIELQKILAVNDRTIRGEYPGIYFLPNTLDGLDDMIVEKGSGNLKDRLIMFKSSAAGNASFDTNNPSNAIVAFDITGPWR